MVRELVAISGEVEDFGELTRGCFDFINLIVIGSGDFVEKIIGGGLCICKWKCLNQRLNIDWNELKTISHVNLLLWES